MSGYDYDFIGFTFNGQHSINDLHIYRTSSGDRYEEALAPTLKEKTASVDGMIGQYYFGTQVESRQFNIPFAFDNLSEKELNNLKKVFNGDGIYPLIFDETPYKVYMAKVTGSNTVKHLCFDVDGHREYRGEGNIQFTCYYPYARSRKDSEMPEKGTLSQLGIMYTGHYDSDIKFYVFSKVAGGINQNCNLTIPAKGQICFDLLNTSNSPLDELMKTATCNILLSSGEEASLAKYATSGEKYFFKYQSTYDYPIVVKKVVMNLPTEITREAPMGTPTGSFYTYSVTAKLRALVGQDGNDEEYYHTTKLCYEPVGAPCGKVFNHYTEVDFPNRFQWMESSNLPLCTLDNINHGDLPTPVILTVNCSTISDFEEGESRLSTLTINNNTIEFTDSQYIKQNTKIKWDTKTGLCTRQDGTNKPQALSYSGDGILQIAVGQEVTTNVPGWQVTGISKSIDFDYLYY